MSNLLTVKEKPILFSSQMVRALVIDKTKTHTRRIIKFPKSAYSPDVSWIKSIYQDGGGNWIAWSSDSPQHAEFTKKAYPNGEGFKSRYQVGDILWIKETYMTGLAIGGVLNPEAPDDGETIDVIYKATYDGKLYNPKWQSSLFMKKIYARPNRYEVISVNPKRAWDMIDKDAYDEGIETWWRSLTDRQYDIYEKIMARNAKIRNPEVRITNEVDRYSALWDSINGNKKGYAWKDNPWVWDYGLREVGLDN